MRNSKSIQRGNSLSVRQLIDERISKIEEQQISEIEAHFHQKRNAILNSIRVKTLKLENNNGTRIDEGTPRSEFQSKVKTRIEKLSSILENEIQLSKEIRHDHGTLSNVLHQICPKTDCDERNGLVNVDAYVEDLLRFDQAIQLDYIAANCQTPIVDEEVEDRVIGELGQIVKTKVAEFISSLEPMSSNRSCRPIPRVPEGVVYKNKKSVNFARTVKPQDPVGNRHASSNNTHQLLQKLQDPAEIERNITAQVCAEMVDIDNKYLKLIADASTLTYNESMKRGTLDGKPDQVDSLWIKRVIPAILRLNPDMICDTVNALSEYASENYSTNKRIQKIIQLETTRTSLN